MKRLLYLFVPGILQKPSRVDDWADHAVRYVHAMPGDARAVSYEYSSGALSRFWGQSNRVADVATLIKWGIDDGLDVVAVGHSNGCELIARALRENPALYVRSVHLIAAACHGDFQKNGLNECAYRQQIGRIHTYCSKGDNVLRCYAPLSSKLGRVFGLGYGNLGYTGPSNLTRDAERATELPVWKSAYGHSTWIEKAFLPETLRLVTSEGGE